MQRSLDRTLAAVVLALLAALVGAEEPLDLHPCSTLVRLGTMDESGTVSRPDTPREFATEMTRYCDYVVLGHFVSVSDDYYDELNGPADQPVVSTFDVSEMLRGRTFAQARIRLERSLLVAPGEDLNRYLSSVQVTEDELFRHELATEVERELAAIRASGRPLTSSQHDRLLDAVKRLVEVPPRTRYQLHEMANRWHFSTSPLTFNSELGAIRTDEIYLLGLSDENTTGLPLGSYFGTSHAYLLWGQEALDVAAALRENQD